MRLDGVGEELASRSTLLAAGFDHREHGLNESASRGALRAEGQLAPNDGVTQGPFAGVVRRFDSLVLEKHPQPVAMGMQFLDTCRPAGLLPLTQAAQQQALHFRCEAARSDRFIPRWVSVPSRHQRPLLEQLASLVGLIKS